MAFCHKLYLVLALVRILTKNLNKMIDHIIHFYQKGFYYTWHLQLPYRLVLGDFVHEELLENRGKLQYDKVIEDKFYELEYDECLIVERLEIDHNADVVAWLNIPKE